MNQLFLIVRGCLLLPLFFSISASAVTLQVTPSTVTTTSASYFVLAADGFSSGEKVKIERIVDINGNGNVDAEDFVIQSFFVIDNQASKIAEITNSNVPSDANPTAGAILVRMNFQAGSEVQRSSGKFIYRVSGTSGTASANFSVNQPASTEKVQGRILSGGNPVAGAVLALLTTGENNKFISGAFSGPDGTYSMTGPLGAYAAIGLKPGFYGSFESAAPVTISQGQTINADVSILPATGPLLSGMISDSVSGAPILSMGQIFASNDSGLYAVTLLKSDSTYSLQVPAGQWSFDLGTADILLAGYVPIDHGISGDTSAGNATVNLPLQKANAIFYGSVKDALTGLSFNFPIQISAREQNNSYHVDAFTLPDGTYSAGALAGTWYLGLGSEDNQVLPGYIISQGGPYSISAGQAVQVEFIAQAATHTISGVLKDSNNNFLPLVTVFADATVNGQHFQVTSKTDSQGRFSLPAVNSTWNVNVDSSALAELGLQGVPSQVVTVSNNDPTITLIASAPTAHIQGQVVDENGQPVANTRVIASASNSYSMIQADNSGFYDIGVTAGPWSVSLESSYAEQSNLISSVTNVTVIDAQTLSNVKLNVRHSTFNINGTLKSDTGEPLGNVFVFASVLVNSTFYSTSTKTLSDGSFTLKALNGSWTLSVNNSEIVALGLETPPLTTVVVNNANAAINLVAPHPSPAPSISNLVRLADGRVQFHINDTSTSHTIRVMATSDFINWETGFGIPTTGSGFDYTDNFAQPHQKRFYRITRE
jgi:hypothetical protein